MTFIQNCLSRLKTPAEPDGSPLHKETPFSSRLSITDRLVPDLLSSPNSRWVHEKIPAAELRTGMSAKLLGVDLFLPVRQLRFYHDHNYVVVHFESGIFKSVAPQWRRFDSLVEVQYERSI